MTDTNRRELQTKLDQEIDELKAKLAAAEEKRDELCVPDMVRIPNRAYAVSTTPITVAQYRAFCNATDRNMPNQPEPHNDRNPVVNVTWYDAQAYCEWLSKELDTTIRLPHEDEYNYFVGDHTEATKENAVFGQAHIQPVGTKVPNKFGLYDLCGCVCEWQQDSYYRD